MKKHLVFFDLGNTLEDETEAQKDRAIRASRACGDLGLAVSPDRILELMDEGGSRGIPSVFRYALRTAGLTEQNAALVLSQCAWLSRGLKLFPETVEVLEKLRKNAVMGIIANQSASADERLERYGIRRLFQTVVCSCDIGISKPSPGIFEEAVRRTGKGFASIWMAGDRIDNDIVPAKKLGWRTIRFLRGCYSSQKPASVLETADHTVSQLSEIPGLFAPDRT